MTPQEHLAEAERLLDLAVDAVERHGGLLTAKAKGMETAILLANAHTAIAHAQYAGAAVRGDR